MNTSTMKHNENFVPVVGDKILTMPQGGPIQYRSEFEADRHAKLYVSGYTGGAILRNPEDVV